jgi:uncharacterized protein with HEPN domain
MSSSDNDVMQQKKDDAETVTWREYEALYDNLQHEFHKVADDLAEEIMTVHTNIDTTIVTVNTVKTQLTDMQTTIQAFT